MLDNQCLVLYLNVAGKGLEEYFMETIGGVANV